MDLVVTEAAVRFDPILKIKFCFRKKNMKGGHMSSTAICRCLVEDIVRESLVLARECRNCQLWFLEGKLSSVCPFRSTLCGVWKDSFNYKCLVDFQPCVIVSTSDNECHHPPIACRIVAPLIQNFTDEEGIRIALRGKHFIYHRILLVSLLESKKVLGPLHTLQNSVVRALLANADDHPLRVREPVCEPLRCWTSVAVIECVGAFLDVKSIVCLQQANSWLHSWLENSPQVKCRKDESQFRLLQSLSLSHIRQPCVRLPVSGRFCSLERARASLGLLSAQDFASPTSFDDERVLRRAIANWSTNFAPRFCGEDLVPLFLCFSHSGVVVESAFCTPRSIAPREFVERFFERSQIVAEDAAHIIVEAWWDVSVTKADSWWSPLSPIFVYRQWKAASSALRSWQALKSVVSASETHRVM